MKKLIVCLVVLLVSGVTTPVTAQESDLGGASDDMKRLEDRLRHLEETLGGNPASDASDEPKWYDRFKIGGVIEVEAGYEKTDSQDPAVEDETSGDVDLSAVELSVDADIIDHVEGHVLFKYEDDDVFVDEGFITLTGSEDLPVYLIAGRQYIPFGNYDGHFISDPPTLVLGETNEGAVVAGYRSRDDWFEIALGAFNGRVRETGDDDVVDDFVAAVSVNPLDGLSIGASYTSNIGGSDSFSEVVTDPENVESVVAGWSAYAVYEFLDRFKLVGEYVGAAEDFKAGEIYDEGDALDRQPSAWNVEIGFAVMEDVEIAARYGGSEDGGDFLPETVFGAVVNWGCLENTGLALEYLHGDFEDDVRETDTITAQLAFEF